MVELPAADEAIATALRDCAGGVATAPAPAAVAAWHCDQPEVLRALSAAGLSFTAWLRDSSHHQPLRSRCEAALERLHDGAWSQLHSKCRVDDVVRRSRRAWREAFALCCLMRCRVWAAAAVGDDAAAAAALRRALRVVDLALVVAGAESRIAGAALLAAAASLSSALQPDSAAGDDDAEERPGPFAVKRARVERANLLLTRGVRDASVVVRRPVTEVRGALSLEAFLIGHFAPQQPVLVRGACSNWPAVESWARESFWQSSALGQRFVPVETDYWLETKDESSELGSFRLIQLAEFVRHCNRVLDSDTQKKQQQQAAGGTSSGGAGASGAGGVEGVSTIEGLSRGGYLAQHTLLDQIPALSRDVMTPDITACGESGELLRQLFFGPIGRENDLFCSHSIVKKSEDLPRQARDKHRRSWLKGAVFLFCRDDHSAASRSVSECVVSGGWIQICEALRSLGDQQAVCWAGGRA
jgi:hypothetical protein